MFTGIIEASGRILSRTPKGPSHRLRVSAPFAPFVEGESIAVSGVCLTVDGSSERWFEADASSETLARTTLGGLSIGAAVNLERALPLGGRMGGHLVTGHVDGVARLASIEQSGDSRALSFEVPRPFARYLSRKGSITIDGISLTVNDVLDGAATTRVTVMVIPHTLAKTTLAGLSVESSVNFEVDVLARYVERQLAWLSPPDSAHPAPSDDSLLSKLRNGGYM